MNGDDVGMVERGCGLRFLREAAAAFVRDPFRREHFDGDVTIQSWVMRAVDLAHAARTNERDHLVRSELSAGG